jgi:hypothetical protein
MSTSVTVAHPKCTQRIALMGIIRRRQIVPIHQNSSLTFCVLIGELLKQTPASLLSMTNTDTSRPSNYARSVSWLSWQQHRCSGLVLKVRWPASDLQFPFFVHCHEEKQCWRSTSRLCSDTGIIFCGGSPAKGSSGKALVRNDYYRFNRRRLDGRGSQRAPYSMWLERYFAACRMSNSSLIATFIDSVVTSRYFRENCVPSPAGSSPASELVTHFPE